jgi:hypothetical protein
MRKALAAAVAESTPPLTFRANSGGLFLEEFRNDPEINRLLSELYGN